MLFIFLTPFYCVYPFLLIMPIINGVPILYAGLLPFALIWISSWIYGIQGFLWRNSIISLNKLNERMNMIRGMNAVASVGG